MYAADNYERVRRSFEFHLALVSSPKISVESFSDLQKKAIENHSQLEELSQPWTVQSEKEKAQSEYEEFAEQWKHFHGFDPGNVDDLIKWEERLESAVEAKNTAAEKAEQEEEQLREQRTKIAQEVAQKRMQQAKRRRH